MATIKTSGHSNQPKTVHAGPNTVIMRGSFSATFSAGDVYYIGKIPHGAKITRTVFLPGAALTQAVGTVGTNGNSASVASLFVGTGASANTLSQAVYTNTVLNSLGTRGAANFSLSDGRIVRYTDVTFTPASGVSIGHHFDIVVDYVLDDPSQ
jgi:hypothetical protein